jgi:hypothetical protein
MLAIRLLWCRNRNSGMSWAKRSSTRALFLALLRPAIVTLLVLVGDQNMNEILTVMTLVKECHSQAAQFPIM